MRAVVRLCYAASLVPRPSHPCLSLATNAVVRRPKCKASMLQFVCVLLVTVVYLYCTILSLYIFGTSIQLADALPI